MDTKITEKTNFINVTSQALSDLSKTIMQSIDAIATKVGAANWSWGQKHVQWKYFYDYCVESFDDTSHYVTQLLIPTFKAQALHQYSRVRDFCTSNYKKLHAHPQFTQITKQFRPYLNMAKIPATYHKYVYDGIVVVVAIIVLFITYYMFLLVCELLCPRMPKNTQNDNQNNNDNNANTTNLNANTNVDDTNANANANANANMNVNANANVNTNVNANGNVGQDANINDNANIQHNNDDKNAKDKRAADVANNNEKSKSKNKNKQTK